MEALKIALNVWPIYIKPQIEFEINPSIASWDNYDYTGQTRRFQHTTQEYFCSSNIYQKSTWIVYYKSPQQIQNMSKRNLIHVYIFLGLVKYQTSIKAYIKFLREFVVSVSMKILHMKYKIINRYFWISLLLCKTK